MGVINQKGKGKIILMSIFVRLMVIFKYSSFLHHTPALKFWEGTSKDGIEKFTSWSKKILHLIRVPSKIHGR